MYAIELDDSFTSLQRLLTSELPKWQKCSDHPFLSLVHNSENCRVQNFAVTPESTKRLTFRKSKDPKGGDFFQVVLRVCRAAYTLVDCRPKSKQNRSRGFVHNCCPPEINNDSTIDRRNVLLLGIPLGHLVRLYAYQSMASTTTANDAETKSHFSDVDLDELALRIKNKWDSESNSDGPISGLGVIHLGNGSFDSWEFIQDGQQSSLKSKNRNKASHNNTSMDSKCNQLVYFSESNLLDLLTRTTPTKGKKTKNHPPFASNSDVAVNQSNLEKFFNQRFCSKLFTRAILQYVSNQESTLKSAYEVSTSSSSALSEMHFDEPTCVVSILEQVSQMDNLPNNEEMVSKCKFLIKIITRSNVSPDKLDKFPDSCFQRLSDIPESYPMYAYQNVYLKQFNPLCDLVGLDDRNIVWKKMMKDPKFRHNLIKHPEKNMNRRSWEHYAHGRRSSFELWGRYQQTLAIKQIAHNDIKKYKQEQRSREPAEKEEEESEDSQLQQQQQPDGEQTEVESADESKNSQASYDSFDDYSSSQDDENQFHHEDDEVKANKLRLPNLTDEEQFPPLELCTLPPSWTAISQQPVPSEQSPPPQTAPKEQSNPNQSQSSCIIC